MWVSESLDEELLLQRFRRAHGVFLEGLYQPLFLFRLQKVCRIRELRLSSPVSQAQEENTYIWHDESGTYCNDDCNCYAGGQLQRRDATSSHSTYAF